MHGGVIIDPRGHMVKNFASRLGHKTNNEVEWMALLQGLEIIDRRYISRLLVFRDSRRVIHKMTSGYTSRSINCRRLFGRITQPPLLANIDYFHILRENNAQVDAQENIGTSIPQGFISLNYEEARTKTIP